MTDTRTPTAVDRVAERYLDLAAEHDPMTATFIGVAGHDDRMPELSPDWLAQGSQLRRDTLAELAAAEAVDANDRITIAALREHLEVHEELRAAGAEEADLKNIASPLQSIRDTFDITPAV